MVNSTQRQKIHLCINLWEDEQFTWTTSAHPSRRAGPGGITSHHHDNGSGRVGTGRAASGDKIPGKIQVSLVEERDESDFMLGGWRLTGEKVGWRWREVEVLPLPSEGRRSKAAIRPAALYSIIPRDFLQEGAPRHLYCESKQLKTVL